MNSEGPENLSFRRASVDETPALAELVGRVFDAFVAADFTPQGVMEFRNFIAPEKMAARMAAESTVYVAHSGEALAGMVELNHPEHIALLFVDQAYQGQGVARALLGLCISEARLHQPGLPEMTVNASLYAVEAYRRLGFERTGAEQEKNGLRFVPMRLRLI